MQNNQTILLGLMTTLLVTGCAEPLGLAHSTGTRFEQQPLVNDQHALVIPTKCAAEVLRPAVFREEPIRVLVYDGSASYSNIPAELDWHETRIQVEPARHAQETEPAQYEQLEDIIETERARSELYAEPAKYHTVIREILVKPEHKRWKDSCIATADTQCIETVAAEYAKISTELVKEPAQIHQRSIPAKTITLKRKKLVKAGKGIGQPIPARYETVRIVRVSKPWKIISSLVPPQYDTLTTTRKLRAEQIITMPTTCDSKLTKTQIIQIQRMLNQNGHTLALTGSLDTATLTALQAFQIANRLAIGAITLETLRKLGLA